MISSRTFYAGLGELAVVAGLMLTGPAAPAAGAGELDLSGSVAFETRLFFDELSFSELTDQAQVSLTVAPEIDYETEEGRHRFSLIPFLRPDSRDGERARVDLREAWWRRVADDWELLVGVDKVFWGVTESCHLVDVVNQDDAAEDVDGEEKLGQPMVALTLVRGWGTLGFYLMPYFRERTFPGTDGRLRSPLPVDTGEALYESAAGERHVDFALRYSTWAGGWDLGLSYFDGTSREPRLVPDDTGERLRPFYDLVRQAGVDLQYTRSAWLWKLEGIVREGHGPTFGALVGGFEYTLYQLGGGAADLGLLVEYLYDGRDPAEAPPTVFDDDLFFGARLAVNDVQDTALLLGGLIDRRDGSWAVSLEVERRLGNRWKVELESRLFFDVAAENLLVSFETDDFLTLRLSRFF